MGDKKRYGRIQHAPYSLDLAPFALVFIPKLKSDLHRKLFSVLDELPTEPDL